MPYRSQLIVECSPFSVARLDRLNFIGNETKNNQRVETAAN